MTDKEHKALSDYIKKCTERVKTDKEYARKLLIATGMYTPTDKLKKRFR